jgi:HAD superfamily hydrolase (TIGR01549 family)
LGQELETDPMELFQEWRELVNNNHSENPQDRYLRFSLQELGNKYNFTDDLKEELFDTFKEELSNKLKLINNFEFILKKETQIKKILFTEDVRELNEIKVEKFGLQNQFDLIINGDDVGYMKPDLKYLQIVWNEFDLKPEECAYIGDRWEKDCELGQEMGGIGIIIGRKDERADFEIESFEELEDILIL